VIAVWIMIGLAAVLYIAIAGLIGGGPTAPSWSWQQAVALIALLLLGGVSLDSLLRARRQRRVG